MILEITFHDNDFTQFIEDFFKMTYMDKYLILSLRTKHYRSKKDEESLQKYYDISVENDDLLDDLYKDGDKPTEEHINKFIELFKESLLLYLSEIRPDNIEYLTNELSIKNVKSVKSKWRNGEVVYWFADFHSFVTM